MLQPVSIETIDRRISIAPMMAWTDRHYRYLMRLISRHVLLYTEMVHTGALLRGDTKRFLAFHPIEHPLALQLGGNDPVALAECAKLAEQWQYDEVNLNVGCPSDRVRSGAFGACLMAQPELVADCVRAMQQATNIPVTVKTRIGIDDRDSYEQLTDFIEQVSAAGCEIFIIHARKAWLQGLSPKQNREVPPLKYDWVYRLKQDFPNNQFVINGGLNDIASLQTHVDGLDGVMIGREAYHNPLSLSQVDKLYYNDDHPQRTPHEVVQLYLPYMQSQLSKGIFLKHMAKHLLNLFQGQPGAKAWRRYLSENMHARGAGVDVVQRALAQLTS